MMQKILVPALFLVAALSLGAALLLWQPVAIPLPTAAPATTVPTATPNPAPVGTPDLAAESTLPPAEGGALPVGKLVITPTRQGYAEGALTLTIPALSLVRPIYNGTAASTLSRGVGLYEYAQLPSEDSANVSLAGHRNGLDKNGKVTDHAPFYYVDTLGEGDYLYLEDEGHVYRYCYESTTVVTADDWSPIYTTGASVLTITSCTPIGISDHRIVVRAALDEVFPRDDTQFNYLATQEEIVS